MILCTVWLGIIGFLDDYFKLRARKKAQELGEKFIKKENFNIIDLHKEKKLIIMKN
jgi:phospho-N-acetylmuramoyl-pentapeptide-transferase